MLVVVRIEPESKFKELEFSTETVSEPLTMKSFPLSEEVKLVPLEDIIVTLPLAKEESIVTVALASLIFTDLSEGADSLSDFEML